MMRNIFAAVLLLTLSLPMLVAQEDVLFTMEEIPVTIAEFEHSYNKNSGIPGADIPVGEYLERYINFRLKVLEAERMGYDTNRAFMEELSGYRDQLAAPYLRDEQTIESLIREAYDRTVHEVNVSQILLLLPENPVPEDTLRTFQKAMEVRSRLIGGEAFEQVAVGFSEDPSVMSNQGEVGWFSAFTMVFPFEDAAYRTKVDSITSPVRTSYGYHIIRVNGKRKALGEIRLAHIMVRASMDEGEATREEALKKISQYVKMLNNGEDFGEVARQYSEDASTAVDNGRMQWIRSGQLPTDIESAVFSLEDSGSYTQPLRSAYGWHIFQLLEKRPIGTFEELEARIREKVLSDDRILLADQAFIRKMKAEAGFVEYPSNIAYLVASMDSAVYSGRWDPDVAGSLIEPVFVLGGREYLQSDLANAVIAVKQYPGNISLQDIVRQKCDEMIRNRLMEYRKSRLEEDFPEFRDLMQEYHDGILLFNISDDMVWQRAILDTAGLEAYYQHNLNQYIRPEQAMVETYTFQDGTLLDRVKKYAKRGVSKNLPAADVLQAIYQDDTTAVIQFEQGNFDSGQGPFMDGMKWKKGALRVIVHDTIYQVQVLRKILPSAPEALSEIRGLVMADYQDYLELQWIEELKQKYQVSIHQEGLKKVMDDAEKGLNRN